MKSSTPKSGLRRAIAILLSLFMTGQLTGMAAYADNVLVLGGTGKLGVRIVRLLVDAGHDVTVFVRPTSDRAPLEDLDVAYVVGDLVDAGAVARAFAAAQPDIVISAVRAPLGETGFYATMTRNIVDAADVANVRQIIHHGAVGAGDNMALHPDVPWDAIPGLKDRMLDHGIAERNLLESGVNVTIMRNSQVWPDRFPATGKAELFEDPSVLMPIIRADLAILTMRCVNNPDCSGKVYHVGDPSLVGKERPAE